jgi:hypothetical protein
MDRENESESESFNLLVRGLNGSRDRSDILLYMFVSAVGSL